MSLQHPLAAVQQQDIEVRVDCLDATHRTALGKYACASTVSTIDGTSVKIPTGDFLAYCLFHRQQPSRPLYSTFSDCYSNIDRSAVWLEEEIEFNGQSISVPLNSSDLPNDLRERIGEAVGLCVADKLYGLHGADWEKIPQQYGKGNQTLDWRIAATDSSFVELETKGSFYEPNSNSKDVDYHIKSITKKKVAQRTGKKNLAELLGSIAVMGLNAADPVQCWLLDPPAASIDQDPDAFKLLARQRFLRDWISFIGPRSVLASVLADRVSVLETLTDFSLLDGLPLKSSSGEPIQLVASLSTVHLTWFGSKSRVQNESIGGVLVPWNGSQMLFVGFEESLLSLSAEQSFANIRNYQVRPRSRQSSVDCVLSDSRFKLLGGANVFKGALKDSQGRWNFERSCILHSSTSGLVFGWVPKS